MYNRKIDKNEKYKIYGCVGGSAVCLFRLSGRWPAADADTASDKHDTAARNSARIRFFFTLNTSSKDVGEGKSLPHIVLCDNYCTASHAMMNRTDAMAVFVTASETGVTMAS